MRYTVRTPVPDFTGLVGAVGFANGTAVIDAATHEAELDYCRRAGYVVEQVEGPDEPTESSAVQTRAQLGFTPEQIVEMQAADAKSASTEMPRRSASTEAWRAYALTQAMSAETAENLTRDQLVERFADPEETS